MFVETQFGRTSSRGLTSRQIEYALATSLAIVTVVLFFVMGFFSTVSAAPPAETAAPAIVSSHQDDIDVDGLLGPATAPAPSAMVQLLPFETAQQVPAAETPRMTGVDTATKTGSIPAAVSADRFILTGAMLLSIAAMAAFAFALWRWQVRGLATETSHHAG